jgi:hypothetical protein
MFLVSTLETNLETSRREDFWFTAGDRANCYPVLYPDPADSSAMIESEARKEAA